MIFPLYWKLILTKCWAAADGLAEHMREGEQF
jgi:hypothetical protein